jgi:hypothetical protein
MNIKSKFQKVVKRGISVYPSWDLPTNQQALKNQKWQLDYFVLKAKDNMLVYNFIHKNMHHI